MKFHVSRQFQWNIQEGVPRFYQATGISNGAKTIVTVQATDLNGACIQIKQQYPNFKLNKIIVFKKPVLVQDDTGTTDPFANSDVTPDLQNCENCCELLPGFQAPATDTSSLSPKIGGISLKAQSKKKSRLLEEEFSPATSNKYDKRKPVAMGLVESVKSYTYWITGVMEINSGTTIDASDLGELSVDIPVAASVESVSINRAYLPLKPLPLPQVTETVRIACVPVALSTTLELRHTLNQLNLFSSFLKTNGLSIPGVIDPGGTNTSFIKLNFHAKNNQWQGGISLTGQSATGNGTESWNIGAQFGCEGDDVEIAFSVINTQTSKRYSSRLLTYYRTNTVVSGNNFFGLKFSIDTGQMTSIPASSQPIVLNDDAGFFRNLRLGFRIVPQNIGIGSYQSEADNTAAYDATLTGGKE